MVEVTSQSSDDRLPRRHVWLRLSLAALFLYNPFVAAPSSGFGLNVRQSASNRATVGASELQHFRVPEFHTAEILIDEPAYQLVPVDGSVLERYAPPNPQVRTPKSVLAGSVWFRPPPVA